MTEHADAGLGLDDGLWLTITELAEHKGLGKPWISEKVKALEADGKIETRSGKGKTKLVNLAQFDRAVGETGDAVKEAAAETRAEAGAGGESASPVLRDHQARAAQYAADLKFLDLEERLGRLVLIAEVKAAGIEIAEVVVTVIGGLSAHAEGVAAVAAKDGVQGVRGMLKDIEHKLRDEIAKGIGKLVGKAVPATIEPTDSGE